MRGAVAVHVGIGIEGCFLACVLPVGCVIPGKLPTTIYLTTTAGRFDMFHWEKCRCGLPFRFVSHGGTNDSAFSLAAGFISLEKKHFEGE